MAARLDPDADPAAVVRAIESLGYKASPQTGAASAAPLVHGCGPSCTHDQDRSDAADTAPDHATGSRAHDRSEDEDEEHGASWWLTGKAKLVWLLGSLVVAAWIGSRLFAAETYWIFLATSLIAVIPFGQRAATLARAGSPFSIETLMSVAVLGAVAIGAAEEATTALLRLRVTAAASDNTISRIVRMVEEATAYAIAVLRRMGLTSVMVTGDNERTSRAIAVVPGLALCFLAQVHVQFGVEHAFRQRLLQLAE